MKEIKLISMTDFVIQNENMVKTNEIEMSKDLYNLAQYAHFLKQPLKLGMFIPCDENDVPIYKPDSSYYDMTVGEHEQLIKYEVAKERVLFEGFKFKNTGLLYNERIFWVGIFNTETIENILIAIEPKLTESAIKQLSL